MVEHVDVNAEKKHEKTKNILISVLLKEDERVLTPNERKVIARFRSTIKEKYGEVFEW